MEIVVLILFGEVVNIYEIEDVVDRIAVFVVDFVLIRVVVFVVAVDGFC